MLNSLARSRGAAEDSTHHGGTEARRRPFIFSVSPCLRGELSLFVVIKPLVGNFSVGPAARGHLRQLLAVAALERNVVLPLRIRDVAVHRAAQQLGAVELLHAVE